MRILLVDDERLALARMRAALETAPPGSVDIIGESSNGAEAIAAILTLSPELVFLDIRMPDIDGFAVVRAVGPSRMPVTVFVTAHDEYALAAFEAQGLDYVLKPFSDARLLAAVDKARLMVRGAQAVQLAALDQHGKQRRDWLRSLTVRRGDVYEILPIDKVEWLESEGNYVRAHLTEDGRTGGHFVRTQLSRLEEGLDPEIWARVHRSTIVRRSAVRRASYLSRQVFELEMVSGTRVTTSRSYASQVREMLGEGAERK